MLKIVQAGEVGKTRFLFDMHRLRKRVFNDRMNWPVTITPQGLEVDQYDLPEAVYLLALDNDERVIGNWRLLPTTGPTMIRDVWPDFLKTISIPFDWRVWEASRFSVDSLADNSAEGLAQVNRATLELFCGLTELCLLCGIHQIYTMYDMRIARLLQRVNCTPCKVSSQIKIGKNLSIVGAFLTDERMLTALRSSGGIKQALVTTDMLPPLLQNFYQFHQTNLLEAGAVQADGAKNFVPFASNISTEHSDNRGERNAGFNHGTH